MAGVETLARGEDSRLVQPRRFLIRDRESFAAVYAAHAGQDAAVPAVDFETRMVAAIFAGERPTPGFSVEVIGTRREGSALVVLVEEKGEEKGTLVYPRESVVQSCKGRAGQAGARGRSGGEAPGC